ncbi:MAG: hypothetical protein EZS28_022826 [Streblomastix strix]|uniref:Uncharacterized protein n=1 Tax=Streblomastix strix TaxID=222440 RepID=A0A5J4VGC9_9EUKA|nr:MAG: hypothetical protein EZS28_022826 [Streblomastix strix]
MIQTPNLLHSLILLYRYNFYIHTNKKDDREALLIRNKSGYCLDFIQEYGDESDQSELVNSEYAVVLVLSLSTAGGDGEQDNRGIWNRLIYISRFMNSLHQRRQTSYFNRGPSFPQQIRLARRSDEQIEEEGGNEEIEAQLFKKGFSVSVNYWANQAQGNILNYFIHRSNQKPKWYR